MIIDTFILTQAILRPNAVRHLNVAKNESLRTPSTAQSFETLVKNNRLMAQAYCEFLACLTDFEYLKQAFLYPHYNEFVDFGAGLEMSLFKKILQTRYEFGREKRFKQSILKEIKNKALEDSSDHRTQSKNEGSRKAPRPGSREAEEGRKSRPHEFNRDQVSFFQEFINKFVPGLNGHKMLKDFSRMYPRDIDSVLF